MLFVRWPQNSLHKLSILKINKKRLATRNGFNFTGNSKEGKFKLVTFWYSYWVLLFEILRIEAKLNAQKIFTIVLTYLQLK